MITVNAELTIDRLRAALTGPVASIRTPFTRDGAVDFDGVRSVIDFNLQAESKVALLTAGDSHFTCMSDDNIAQINRVTVEHVAGRVLTVACDWEFATPQAVQFAKYCADLGADILMARPPDWAKSCTVESLVAHYAAVGEHVPVMIVTNIFGARTETFALETLRALVGRVPTVMALKEDVQNDIARKIAVTVHPQWAVFSGGGLRNFLNMHPFGCDGFMDRHMNFAPQVSHRFWNAVQQQNMSEARTVIEQVELPLEQYMGTFAGGRDAAIHGLLEIFEIAGRWRRPPYHSLTDTEMTELRAFVKNLGLL